MRSLVCYRVRNQCACLIVGPISYLHSNIHIEVLNERYADYIAFVGGLFFPASNKVQGHLTPSDKFGHKVWTHGYQIPQESYVINHIYRGRTLATYFVNASWTSFLSSFRLRGDPQGPNDNVAEKPTHQHDEKHM
jgi:hypothetical protein